MAPRAPRDAGARGRSRGLLAAVLPVLVAAACAGRAPASPPGALAPELTAALPRLEAALRASGCAERPEGLPPTLRVDAGCRVQTAVVLRGDPEGVAGRIRAAGGTVTRSGGDPVTLQAWLPPALLRTLGADADVAAVRLPHYVQPVPPAGTAPR